MQVSRKLLRGLPCKFFASASLEQAIEASDLGLATLAALGAAAAGFIAEGAGAGAVTAGLAGAVVVAVCAIAPVLSANARAAAAIAVLIIVILNFLAYPIQVRLHGSMGPSGGFLTERACRLV
jgi:hypothetical protein